MKLVSDSLQLSATDLSNHLGCRHLTELNRLVALGQLTRPHRNDPSLEVLEKRGREHEQAYVAFLKDKGLSVLDLRGQPTSATLEAMAKAYDVIVQAKLEHDQWMGYADILLKVQGKSKFGNWSYEIQDTKLAQQTRAATILQLCLYSDLLSTLQRVVPQAMYVVKPGDDFPTEKYWFWDFQAYYRLSKSNYENIASEPRQTYPEEVEHCGICNWWSLCDKKRHEDDHLSLVAGMRNAQVQELKNQKLQTLKSFAEATVLERPSRGNLDSLMRRQAQARVQLEGRIEEKLVHQFLAEEPGRGFHRLPEPDLGDVYFDIEGDAFFPGGSLEYLLGYAYRDGSGNLKYEKLWATNRAEEKRAFERFMQFVSERRKQYRNLYIYHFAPYEPSAIKRLARVHAIYEKEVDELLREQRFIDLHAVFKEALLASVERYSLKDLEKFTTYTRIAELHDASKARKTLECALELNEFNSLSSETIQLVEVYNEDDCLATEALHQWLDKLRGQQIAAGKQFMRPIAEEGAANEKIQAMEARTQALFKALTQDLPEADTAWNAEERAKWLLAHQIEYFRREDKSAWWEYYRVHELEYDELFDERKAIASLQFVEALPLKGRERTPVHRYRFPPQEVVISQGDELHEVKGDKIGTVQAISLENYTVDIKKTAKTVDRHPFAVHVFERIDPGTLATSLMNLAQEIDDSGLEHTWPYHASKDLLMKRKPKLLGGLEGVELQPGEDLVKGAVRIALNLDKSILPIQGPPGTGKTYTGAKMIIGLVKEKKKVGITAISHSVIRTLFEKTRELCDEEGCHVEFVHKVTDTSDQPPAGVIEVTDTKKALAALDEGKVVGGTAWLWADDQSRETLDYLFIDEAGQMSLSQALAASRAAKNIVLLGDPQQLEQPQRGAHPEGSDVAALAYLLDGHQTMKEGHGLFLGVTRRIHPAITQFTSEIFYENRLTSLPGLENQVISGGTSFDGAGLMYIPVEHAGNQNRSNEEVSAIVRVVGELLKSGKYTDSKGVTKTLVKDDILIVAPYNAQVAALIEKLPDFRIGTVDKFQGKEAPVVIYSMTSSSVHDAPRGMSFLFSPNRLNVATSRAKSICILVASPFLLEPECHTIDQMRWANALCRYTELATCVITELNHG
jgi:predicted RecB family nuclease